MRQQRRRVWSRAPGVAIRAMDDQRSARGRDVKLYIATLVCSWLERLWRNVKHEDDYLKHYATRVRAKVWEALFRNSSTFAGMRNRHTR